MRQNDGSANYLIGMLRIDAQIDGQLNRFVELGVVRLLDQLRCFLELVRTRFHFLARVLYVFACLLHAFTSSTS